MYMYNSWFVCDLQNMVYDLGDATKWEFFFPNVEQPLLVVPEDSSATVVPEEGGKVSNTLGTQSDTRH